MLGEAQAILRVQLLVLDEELLARPRRQAKGITTRRGAETAQLRVQLAQVLEGDVGGLGDHVQVGSVGHPDLFGLARLLVVDVEPEPLGMLGDERGRDQLRNVVLRLGAQRPSLAHHAPEVGGLLLADGAADPPLARVVPRPSQVPVAVEPGLEILQVLRCRDGGLGRIAPLVHPEVGEQPVAAGSADDELPGPGGLRE